MQAFRVLIEQATPGTWVLGRDRQTSIWGEVLTGLYRTMILSHRLPSSSRTVPFMVKASTRSGPAWAINGFQPLRSALPTWWQAETFGLVGPRYAAWIKV